MNLKHSSCITKIIKLYKCSYNTKHVEEYNIPKLINLYINIYITYKHFYAGIIKNSVAIMYLRKQNVWLF